MRTDSLTVVYPAPVTRMRTALLVSRAVLAPDLRQAIEAYAAHLSGGARPPTTLPTAIEAYVHMVAQHAYRVTHEAIDALKIAGYSEDAIFEITLCAALGASSSRYEQAMALLSGGA